MSTNYSVYSTGSQNADYMKAIQTAMSQYGLTFTDATSYVNSIWGVCGDVDALVNGELTSSQKEAVYVDLIKKGFSFVVGFFNKFGQAENDTNTSSDKIKTTLDKYRTERDATTKEIDRILNEIENTDMQAIADALDKISNLEGSDYAQLKKDIEEKQQEMQACIEAIEKAKQEGDVDTIYANFEQLEILRGEIKGILATSQTTITAAIAEQSKIVAEHTAHITELQVEAEQELAKEIENAYKNMGDEATEGTKNITFTEKGAVEITTGETLQVAAEGETVSGLFTFGIGAVAAAKTEEQALDYINAGREHISGGSKNLTSVGVALSEMGDGMADVSRYAATIGSMLGNAARLIGDYSTKAADLITDVTGYGSSISECIGDEGTLVTAINEDKKAIEAALKDETTESDDENDNNKDNNTSSAFAPYENMCSDPQQVFRNGSNTSVTSDADKEHNKKLLENVKLQTNAALIGGLFKKPQQ